MAAVGVDLPAALFQRLRVEQQIGYVASCSFHQAADREGILFALQSPQLSGDTLCQHTQRFLSDVADDIARLTAQALAEKRTRLWQQLQPEGDALARARQTGFRSSDFANGAGDAATAGRCRAAALASRALR